VSGAFRGAMAAAVAGVCVVTTDGPAGRFGLTISSMASVSAEPPTLLVCVRRPSPLAAAVRSNGLFAVSVLAAGQAAVAESFAGRARPYDFGADRWAAAASGAPLLAGAAAWFDCQVAHTVEAGTHTVLFGAVVAARRGLTRPLAYTDRGYAVPQPLVTAAVAA
jgi:flavin reductase